MTAELRRNLVLALIGILGGFALVVFYLGAGDLFRRAAPGGEPPSASMPPPRDAPGGHEAEVDPRRSALQQPGDAAAKPEAPPTQQPDRAAAAEQAPAFDVVRVEPTGESVVAGRSSPGSTVELLVDGKPVARAVADDAGQFALVPPALPTGNSEVALRATSPDGRAIVSREVAAVVVAPGRNTRPLVAMMAPDAPTKVLQQPEVPTAVANASEPAAGRAAAAPVPHRVKIVSVDAQEGGRLFVSGEAPPGSALRLYINDTLVSPASGGPDGRVTFTIGRGMRPGAYRIRIDQVDLASGKVVSRAEVPFTVPDAVAQAAPGQGAAPDARTADARPSPGPGGNAATGSVAGQPDGQSAGSSVAGETVPGSGSGRVAEAGAAPSSAGAGRTGGLAATVPLGNPGSTRTPAAGPTPREGRPEGKVMSKAEANAQATAPAKADGKVGANADGGTDVRSGAKSDAKAKAEAQSKGSAQGREAAEAKPDMFVAEINTARISRGDSLWQISRRAYGKGNRYTVIYDANQDQIRNPDLIYPGQIFVLPQDSIGSDLPATKRG